MSAPSSARMTSAVRSPTPGIASNRATSAAKGRVTSMTAAMPSALDNVPDRISFGSVAELLLDDG